jgi:hypothetical protein
MRNSPRKKTFIDRSVQGKLIVRVVCYWILCLFGAFCVLAATPILLSCFVPSPAAPTPDQLVLQTWRTFWPTFFASGLVLPLLILDVVRVSHRFAGPVYRLRNSLRDLANGKPVATVKFREGDFWYEMAEEFNRVATRVRDLEATRPAEPRTSSSTQTPGSVAL